MITLNHFNQLPQAQALRLLEPCVALPAWREALALGRPYATLTALTDRAQQLMQHWGEQIWRGRSAPPADRGKADGRGSACRAVSPGAGGG